MGSRDGTTIASDPPVTDPGHPGSTSDDGSELRDSVHRGLRWSLAGELTGRLASFAAGAVLFRLLAPADFGIYAFALGALTVMLKINDLGLNISLQRRDRPAGSNDVATTLATVGGLLTYGALFALAPAMARLAGRPESTNVLRLLALIIVIDTVVVVPRAMLLRQFRQRDLAIGDLTATLTVAVVGVSLAVAGAGAWAPATATVVGASLNGLMIVRFARHRPRPGWDSAVARRLLRVGLPIAGAGALELILLNVDTFVVAQGVGAEELAFYALAFNIAGWPAAMVSQAVRRVAIGGFAALAHDPVRLAATARKALWLLVALVVPLSTCIAVLAHPLLSFVYGPKSEPAGAVLTWIAVLGAVRVLMSFSHDLLVSTGHQRYVFAVQVTWLTVLTPALIIGVQRDGIRGAAIAHAVVALTVAFPLALNGLRRVLGTRVPWRAIAPVVLATVAAVNIGYCVTVLIDPPIVELVVAGAAMVAIYAAVLAALGQHRRAAAVLMR